MAPAGIRRVRKERPRLDPGKLGGGTWLDVEGLKSSQAVSGVASATPGQINQVS